MSEEKDLQAAHEMGKIYNSFVEKDLLCDFFLESASVFIHASRGYLFLSGTEERLWLESSTNGKPSEELQREAESAYKKGKAFVQKNHLFIPLVIRNSAIGVACFCRDEEPKNFSEKDSALACDLSSQAAAALKNILLFEENLKMERLAAIGRTMSMVLHEIKNIIQLAKFGDEYLKIGVENNRPDYVEKGRAGIKKAIKEMDGFTYEILSLTKDYKIRPEPVNFEAIFDELKVDLRSRAAQYKIQLEFEIEPDFPLVEGETRSLYRMLLNLIKNAIEASDVKKEKSFVKVGVKSLDQNSYHLVIEDNGQGMTEEAKAKIFQAFFSTNGEKGTGLGLLIIDRTVKAHNGKLRVESDLGKGAKFILTLPKTLPRN